MDRIIKLKNFSFSVAVFFVSFLSAQGQVADKAPLPLLQNIGTIPTQWEGLEVEALNLSQSRTLVEAAYPRVIRDSGRFRVINDNLVRSLWSTPEGRSKLRSEYELHGFAALSVEVRQESISFFARLLSPSLENYLIESSTISRAKLATATDREVSDLLADLFFRLFNRLPIDITVLAIQGKYLTLGGGTQQNLQVGQELEIIRPTINLQHPANGTWLKFDQQVVGTAKVLDLKTITAVAEITRQTAPSSIRVGDGMKVANLPARNRFARLQERGGLPATATTTDPIFDADPAKRRQMLVPPSAPGTVVAPGTPSNSPPAMTGATTSPAIASTAQQPSAGTPVPAGTANTTTDSGATPTDPAAAEGEDDFPDFLGMAKNLIDYGYGEIGPRLWTISGAASADSKFPFMFFNYASLGLGKVIMPNLTLEGQMEMQFGQTAKGTFFGFGGSGKAFYLIGDLDQYFRVGGSGSFTSMAVNNESYGGGDLVRGALLAGTGGQTNIASTYIFWFADLALQPLALGQMGVRGTMRSIASAMGWELTLGGTLAGRADAIKWGAYIRTGSQTYVLDNNATLEYGEFSILARADYRF